MKKKSFLFALLLCISLLPLKTNAQCSGKIMNVSVNHNKTRNNESGLEFNITFSVDGMKGSNGSCAVYFYDASGRALTDRNNNCNTTDGKVAVSESFTPPYESTKYTDFSLFIPYRELDLLDNESSVLYCNVIIWGQGKQLVSKKTERFMYSQYGSPYTKKCNMCYGSHICSQCRGTGISRYSTRYSQNLCYSCNGSGFCQLCKGNDWAWFKASSKSFGQSTGGYAGTIPSTEYSQPSDTHDYSTPGSKYHGNVTCPDCKGTGKHTMCNGKGWSYNRYCDMNLDCDMCNKTGICPTCHGKTYIYY